MTNGAASSPGTASCPGRASRRTHPARAVAGSAAGSPVDWS